VLEKAFKLAEAVENEISASNPEGVVSRVSRAKADEALELNDDAFYMLREGLRFSRISEGAYDVTSGGLKALWAKAKTNGEPPARPEIESELSRGDYKNLELDEYGKRLKAGKEGIALNLESIARAYALDKVSGYLDRNEIRSAVVTFGGNLRMLGLSPGSATWKVGVEHPREVEEYAVMLELGEGRSISTTGDYESFFLYKGKRYPHIFSGKTGSPPDNRIASVTVISKNAVFSGLLSEVLFVLGFERGLELIESLKEENAGAILIEERSENQFVLASSEGSQNYIKDIRL
ncbi:MAG: FAD:protein FMN transferase, partial [Candidatus Omnitrophota bacterium]